MEIIFTPEALSHLAYWKESGNTGIQERISALLKSISETPFSGIGKPEPLRGNLSGKWSRRINREHRLIYRVEGGKINVYSLKGHY